MKREALSHTKMSRLMRRLKLRRYQAVGLCELLWHTTAREAPAGDIGKLTDEDIAIALDWNKEPSELIDGFVSAELIDKHDKFRLIIHDWHQHAEDGVHSKLCRSKSFFCTGEKPKLVGLRSTEKEDATEFQRVHNWDATRCQPVANVRATDQPQPSPALPSPALPELGAPAPTVSQILPFIRPPRAGVGAAPVGTPLTLGEIETAWESHRKYKNGDSLDHAVRIIQSVENFDVAKFRERHAEYCEYYEREGWTKFDCLPFIGWIQAGMIYPPVRRSRDPTKPKRTFISEPIEPLTEDFLAALRKIDQENAQTGKAI